MIRLALGADLKGAFALSDGNNVIHRTGFGDLSDEGNLACWSAAIDEALAGRSPSAIAVDLHPRYVSRQSGCTLAAKFGVPLVEIQHHHAHAAAAMNLCGWSAPCLAVVMDGTGYGADGTIWGCEVLQIREDGFRRLGHLRPVACPGGDLAVKEPWRMALAWLEGAGIPAEGLQDLRRRVGERRWDIVGSMIRSGAVPMTSSAGRLFDAAAVAIGLVVDVQGEAEAAMALEQAASEAGGGDVLPHAVERGILDMAPALASIMRGRRAGETSSRLAASFHATLSAGMAELCQELRPGDVRPRVVLTGGCFLNALLSRSLSERLSAAGFEVGRPDGMACTDDYLPLGQLKLIERSRTQ